MIIFVAVFLYNGAVHSKISRSARANLRLSFFNIVLIESTVILNAFKQNDLAPLYTSVYCITQQTDGYTLWLKQKNIKSNSQTFFNCILIFKAPTQDIPLE